MSEGSQKDSQVARAADAWSKAKWEGHRVNLERVQRIFLGIDSEPMQFDESTIAAMLENIARESLPEHSFTLFAIAAALRGNDDHHSLELKQKKPGKWETPTEHEERANRDAKWLWTLGYLEKDGMKTEAAVAKIAESEGVSRASIFAAVKRAEEVLDQAWGLFHSTEVHGPRPWHLTNPRPDKKRNT